ncbi:hypothetical protein EC912_102326 [Luteibacter rhizovicinus]|uniref:Uncharacterized protein n=1 Tax=Luteibacter rhizovicinus TaxID=242606 RepID=A0A4R3YVY4_9GAMM|nr:hypothetical protein [Luteibacter rhizovicinus]TCV95978.1 hypothetical protein EC912_102326 [Luteibacter rhizovicinus]
MTYAEDLKALVISALLPTLTVDEVIGTEVRFGEGQFRADLVIASPVRLSALEIKGPRDNLDKLAGQAEGYDAMFLDFSVVADAAWLDALRIKLPRSAGLMTLSGQSLLRIRQPRIRTRLGPETALRWLRTEDLKLLLRVPGQSLPGHYEGLVELARRTVPAPTLSAFALMSVRDRLQPRFDAFRQELGKTVTLDDVRMLTLGDRITGPDGKSAAQDES